MKTKDLTEKAKEARALERAIIRLDWYWQRRRWMYLIWYILLPLAVVWFMHRVSVFFASPLQFYLTGFGSILYNLGPLYLLSLRQLYAGFVVSHPRRAPRKWRVSLGEKIVFRCGWIVVSVDKARIDSARYLMAGHSSPDIANVLFLYLREPLDDAEAPAVETFRAAPALPPAPRGRPIMIPASADGFQGLLDWLEESVPFESRHWPS